jgi:hypothetical protein
MRCCGELHTKGKKGFSNSHADRVPDFKLKGHYGGPEGGHNEATETEADERREHGD